MSEPGAQYEYITKVYDNVLSWFRNADTKAQIALTLNGIVVSVLTGNLLFGSESAGDPIRNAALITKSLFGLSVAATVVAILTAMLCLWSRLGETQVRQSFGVDPDQPATYGPKVAWWFGAIAQLRSADFLQMIASSDLEFHRDALTHQVWKLSEHALRKHRWVNLSWALTGLSFICMSAGLIAFVVET